MDIAELRDFVAVVRAGSFAGAAEETGVPRSTLSKRIQMLEASLDLRLIERSTRKLRLTADGELLLPRALQLTTEADDIERLMRDRSTVPRGRLRVSVPMMLGQELLGGLGIGFLDKALYQVMLAPRFAHTYISITGVRAIRFDAKGDQQPFFSGE